MPPKPKTHSKWTCQQCGFVSTKSYGRCPECGVWNSMVETLVTAADEKKSSLAALAPRSHPWRRFHIRPETSQPNPPR